MNDCFKADIKKIISGVLYIVKELKKRNYQTDFYRVFKIMYFSDMISLPKYYKTIFGDWYALRDGPIPEDLYHLIKKIRDKKESIEEFSLLENDIIPNVEPDMEELSESDVECINKSIFENGGLTYNELKEKSHGKTWKNTFIGYEMNILSMAKETGVNSSVIEYMKERIINNSPELIEEKL